MEHFTFVELVRKIYRMERTIDHLSLKADTKAKEEVRVSAHGLPTSVIWAIRKRELEMHLERMVPDTNRLYFNGSRKLMAMDLSLKKQKYDWVI